MSNGYFGERVFRMGSQDPVGVTVPHEPAPVSADGMIRYRPATEPERGASVVTWAWMPGPIDVSRQAGGVYGSAADVIRDGLLVHVEANTVVHAGDMLAPNDGARSPMVTTFGTGDGWDPVAFRKELDRLSGEFSLDINAHEIARVGSVSARPMLEAAIAPPSREDERRAIDALLVEDARKTPQFATARKAAVLAAAERDKSYGAYGAESTIERCHKYESLRGGMGKPAAACVRFVDRHTVVMVEAFAAYERARGMR